MDVLSVPAGPIVGAALEYLMDIRLEEGVIGDEAIRARLISWWEENKDNVGALKRSRRPRV
jgi:poly(A) polymerase